MCSVQARKQVLVKKNEIDPQDLQWEFSVKAAGWRLIRTGLGLLCSRGSADVWLHWQQVKMTGGLRMPMGKALNLPL